MKLLGMTRSLTAEVSCEGFYRESGAKNLLAKMIMHLFADTPLLAIGSIQESMLEKPRFGRVADRQKETTAVPGESEEPTSPRARWRPSFARQRTSHWETPSWETAARQSSKSVIGPKKADTAPNHFCLCQPKIRSAAALQRLTWRLLFTSTKAIRPASRRAQSA